MAMITLSSFNPPKREEQSNVSSRRRKELRLRDEPIVGIMTDDVWLVGNRGRGCSG